MEKRNKKRLLLYSVILSLLLLMAIASVTCWVVFSFNDAEYTVTVVRVERENYNEPGEHLIYCEAADGTAIVFENTDEWLRGKFNSSDFYAQIKEGETYTFTVVGVRIPFLSLYQNIIEIKKDGSA